MSNKGFILILSGPSGSGKSSIVREFLKSNSSFDVSISHTTRPIRHNEIDGRDYYFITKRDFEEMVKNEEFIEWAQVHGNYYGTSKNELRRITDSGKNVLLEIDVDGAMQVKKIFGSSVVTVFVITDSFETLKRRLFQRGTESEDVIFKRVENAKKEIERINFYEYVIINKEGFLQESVFSLKSIVDAESLKTERVWDNYKKLFWR